MHPLFYWEYVSRDTLFMRMQVFNDRLVQILFCRDKGKVIHHRNWIKEEQNRDLQAILLHWRIKAWFKRWRNARMKMLWNQNSNQDMLFCWERKLKKAGTVHVLKLFLCKICVLINKWKTNLTNFQLCHPPSISIKMCLTYLCLFETQRKNNERVGVEIGAVRAGWLKKARYVGGKTDSTASATRLSAECFLIIKDILNPESTLTSHNCGSKGKVSLLNLHKFWMESYKELRRMSNCNIYNTKGG